jgi:hypothetical protein
VKTLRVFFYFSFFVLSYWLILSKNAWAYLDPGTSSYLLQLFLGVLLGVVLYFKTWLNKLKNFFRKITPGKTTDQRNE